MHPLIKYVDKGLTLLGKGLFNGIHFFNKYRPNPSFTPKWSEKPLLKSWQKSKPTLGWPRTTDSLCPVCVREARSKILSGDQDYRSLIHEHVGEIKADIVERDGQIWMVKECPEHGKFEDIMAIDSKFLERTCTITEPVQLNMEEDRY
jgi:7,8-dihydro-6-hydroxymethylpterin dimethyltransferase